MEAKFAFSDEECCDGLVVSAMGAGVERLTCLPYICPTGFGMTPSLYRWKLSLREGKGLSWDLAVNNGDLESEPRISGWNWRALC